MKNIIKFLILLPFLSGCADMFNPAIENYREQEALYKEPGLAQGLLGHAYVNNMGIGNWSFLDVATDNAVSNDPNNGYLKMATGQWTAYNSPMNGYWQNWRASIQYINLFISIVDQVKWANDSIDAELFRQRMTGDAYGMRAYYLYHLIQVHAGWTESGDLLGVPIVNQPEDVNSNFNVPRNTLQECVEQIYADVQVATDNLPSFYGDVAADNQVPDKYRNKGVNAAQYTRVFGSASGNRMVGAIAEAIRAQATLLAASPAYSPGTKYTYANAADQFAIVLAHLGSDPVGQIDPNGHTWYTNTKEIDNLKSGINPKEILWRSNNGKTTNPNQDMPNTIEANNFPPTLFGKGRVNPTQNLVDAFPMANGYPITDPASGYNPNDPYAGRDPRLGLYIIYNGSKAGTNNTVITTAADGTDNNALGKTETSTRTGYYMKKLMRQDVNANPSSYNPQNHYQPYIRYTELFLGYAEAANEAWGPTGTGTHGYSAYDVIKAIRARAGVGKDNGDAYLESIKGNKDAMRELIRNERRLELCFEEFRFWDLRRWKAPINEPAKGMRITNGNNYQLIPSVEVRAYTDYMYFCPVPNSEILKFSALVQNKGW